MEATRAQRERIPEGNSAWFHAAMISGAILAAVLLVNSVVNYVWMTPRIVAGQVRREMNRVVAGLEHQSRQMHSIDPSILAALLRNVRRDNEDLAWAELRSRTAGVLAHDGLEAGPSFTDSDVRARLHRREPVTTSRSLPAGQVIVEEFPFHVPVSGPQESGFMQLELAMWADRADSALWPLRKNLIINCTAACALLFALLTMKLRVRSYLRGRRLESELGIAREVQRALLPSDQLNNTTIAAASECVPASGIGGDLHDVFEAPDGKVALVCGDVSGKGIPAALLMGVLHGAIRSLDWFESAGAHESATRRLNRILCDRASDARFASLFWGYYDARAERLHYINAGHCPPMLVRQWRETTEIRTLGDGGPVLGLLARARYEQAQVDLCPGDLLILYSDGVIEATDADGEEFGEERLHAVVDANSQRSPQEIRDAVLKAVRKFAGSSEFADDLTLMAVRFRPEQVARGSESVLDAREVLVS